ncbi:putative O-methyltransferase [Westerdykella ornata]|uniref:Putative O-methyltransferase n=1 Tax=Westerdykella ornata TaxID=318751 RepID=A0A6A6JNX5_WESOR|nr:putative O-methyltransferase [Westerdykella ornata]KAF2276639.1 putative O-methyltransferase [Westerdykella ornata]
MHFLTDLKMDVALKNLIDALRTASTQLDESNVEEVLHDTEKLPDKKVAELASEALDLLDELRLKLEPRQLILADHFLGYMNTKALCAVVEFNIPDILLEGPKTIEELARASQAREDRLGQVMRAMRNNGIFSYDAQKKTYRNNSTSTLLLKDHWTQWRNWVDLYGNEFYDMARGIQQSCRSDAVRSPAQINYDTDDSMFKYFTERGWVPKLHKTLSGGAVAQAPGIVEDYPWHEVASKTVLDVGGGGGGLIASLLRAYPEMIGGVFDMPHVIEQAKANFHDKEGVYADVGSRVPPENLISGDFMVEVPSFEVYTLKWCLHDWNDEKATLILKTIRRAIRESEDSRLVVLECVLKDGHTGRMSRYGDMNMMVAVSGQERDEEQWRQLAKASGWQLTKIFPLRNAWPCAIEFRPF